MRKYAIILLSLLFLSCFNPHPQAPEWDIDITIPLVKERYPVINIVDTLDPNIGIQVGEDSIMQFYLAMDIDTFSIEDSLCLEDLDTLISRRIGDAWISNLGIANVSVSVREIAEGIGIGLPDTPYVAPFIPPFSYTSSLKSGTFDMVDSIYFTVVCLSLRFVNQTGLSFDSVSFVPVSGLEIDPIIFTQLSSNSLIDTTLYIEDAVIKGDIQVRLGFATVDTLFGVLLSPDDSVSVSLVLDSVKIGNGRIKIPSFRDSIDYEFNFPFLSDYSFDLGSIVFSRGSLYLNIDNGLPIGGRLTARIEELDTSFVVSLSPDEPSTEELSLTDMTYDNTGSPVGSTLLSMKLIMALDSSSGFVDITANDSIAVGVNLEAPDYSLIAGEILEPITYPIDYNLEVPVEYGDIGCVRLAESQLYVDIWNTIGFASSASGSITGKNSYYESVSIPFSLLVDAGTPHLPPLHSEFSCDLSPILNILPEEIVISGDVSLKAGKGILEKTSYITGSVCNETPFRVAFTEDTIYFDTSEVEIEKDLTDALSNLQSVNLQVDVRNHFPFGLDCDIVVIKPSPEADSFIKRISIPPAPCDQNGVAISPKLATIKIAMDSLEFDILQNPPFSTFAILYIPETDTIAVHARDYLEFDAYCVIGVRIRE